MELAGRFAGARVDGAVVAHVDTAVDVTTAGRGSGAEDGVDDVHQGHALVCGVHIGVVAFAVDEDAALAAVEAFFREVGASDVVTPVGAGVDGGLQLQFVFLHGTDEGIVAAMSGFEVDVGVGYAVDGLVPDDAVLDGIDTHIDVGRAVDVAEVTAAIYVVLNGTARDVDNRGGAHGGVGEVAGEAFTRIAVADVLGATVDGLFDEAVFNIHLLETVDNPGATLATHAAAIDVMLEGTVLDVDDDVRVENGVGQGEAVGRGVGREEVALVIDQAAEGVGRT